MQDCECGWAAIAPVEDALAVPGGPGPGDDDDDQDDSGGGSGGNIDPDDDEGYDDDDDDEEPLRCAASTIGFDASLRRSDPWYDVRVRRSASFRRLPAARSNSQAIGSSASNPSVQSPGSLGLNGSIRLATMALQSVDPVAAHSARPKRPF